MRDEPDVLREAREELVEAVAWYRERDPRAAAAFVAEIRTAIMRIRNMPWTWPEDVAGTRRVLLHRFPYKVVYRASEDRLVIVAFAHQKRHPDYWRRR